jgi:hypothetical protein
MAERTSKTGAVNVDLGRVHTRPKARGATGARIGLFAADDLGAVGEETLGGSRNGPRVHRKVDALVRRCLSPWR